VLVLVFAGPATMTFGATCYPLGWLLELEQQGQSLGYHASPEAATQADRAAARARERRDVSEATAWLSERMQALDECARVLRDSGASVEDSTPRTCRARAACPSAACATVAMP
jgi:hypothetical protein